MTDRSCRKLADLMFARVPDGLGNQEIAARTKLPRLPSTTPLLACTAVPRSEGQRDQSTQIEAVPVTAYGPVPSLSFNATPTACTSSCHSPAEIAP